MFQGPKGYIKYKYVKYTCSMETVQQNGRLTLFTSKFPSNIYSILFVSCPLHTLQLLFLVNCTAF